LQKLASILHGLRIPYVQQTSNALNICCPFHGDRKFHCGVFTSSLRFHCFKCKRTGSLYHLLREAVNISQDDYKRLVGNKPLDETDDTPAGRIRQRFLHKPENAVSVKPVPLPKSRLITEELVNENIQLKRFLDERHITIETCEDYQCRFVGGVGEYANRIILPVWDDQDRVVTFQARDVTGKAKAKYLSGHGYSIYQCLYWTETTVGGDPLYIVEGIFDCWRMKQNAVATFGKQLSQRQTMMLVKENPDEVVFCWDADAYNIALAAVRQLACILRRVGIVRLPEGNDPDSLGSKSVRNLPVRWI